MSWTGRRRLDSGRVRELFGRWRYQSFDCRRTKMLMIALALMLSQDAPEDLVRKLGVDDYAEREKATDALRKLGKGAEEALKKGQESQDPEVRSRSKALLEELKPAAAPRRAPARPPLPFGNGFRGSSVSVQTLNGDSTYVI